MARIDLPDETYNEILRLARLYRRQAEKCQAKEAYLAGCVMLGAALEAILLATANCFPDEAAASSVAPHVKGGAIKPLLAWSLADLLRVAKDKDWLPSGLSLDEDWDATRAAIGDYAEVVRQIRNLAHPVRYAKVFKGRRITKRYLASSFEIVDAAADYMMHKIRTSLHALIAEKENRAAKRTNRELTAHG